MFWSFLSLSVRCSSSVLANEPAGVDEVCDVLGANRLTEWLVAAVGQMWYLRTELLWTDEWITHHHCSNSGLRLLPSGLNQRGLFDFIFSRLGFLPDWAVDCTAEWTARLPRRLFPLCRPRSSRYHRGTRQSNLPEIKLISSDRKQRATCWEHGQHFPGFLSETPHRL